MDVPLGTLSAAHRLSPLSHPSVLIVEPHALMSDALRSQLRSGMPNVVFDLCESRDEGLSMLGRGAYHAVISDARLADGEDCLLLRTAQGQPCPVPLVLSAKRNQEADVLSRLLQRGAFDIVRCSSRSRPPSAIVASALWLYQLRMTILSRRQRLEVFRRRQRDQQAIRSYRGNLILQQTVADIEQTNALCDRTVRQIELSVHLLEETSRQLEADARECALRVLPMLDGAIQLS